MKKNSESTSATPKKRVANPVEKKSPLKKRGGTNRPKETLNSSLAKSKERLASPSKPKTKSKTPAKTTPNAALVPKRRAAFKPPRVLIKPHERDLFVGVTLCIGATLSILSLLSPNQGAVTSSLGSLFRSIFGWLSPIVSLFIFALGFYFVGRGSDKVIEVPKKRVWGGVILFVSAEALAVIRLMPESNNAQLDWTYIATQSTSGGYLGGFFAWIATSLIGGTGGGILFLALALLGILFLLNLTIDQIGEKVQEFWTSGNSDEDSAESNPVTPPKPKVRATPKISLVDLPADEEKISPAQQRRKEEEIRQKRRAETQKQPSQPPTPPATKKAASTPNSASPTPSKTQGSWPLPDLTRMLISGTGVESNSDEIERQKKIIEKTLDSFGAPVSMADPQIGPTLIQFRVEPLFLENRGGNLLKVKVSKIANLADDLALALAAKSVRVQAPIPGTPYVGIEVPNTQKVLVSLRDVMESAEYRRIKSPLRVGLGQDVAGNAVVADLAKMPHLLVAGATGSGKSVCVNAIIACLLLQNPPDQLRFVMVDPKRVELTGYNGIPHLAVPVVVDMDKVVGTLQWALREMERRYQMFAQIGSRNIISYNQAVEALGQPALPYIVIIIDELADLMMTAPEDTEKGLARLAQMARATGMHMIIATQRPSVDVVTGLIKANFPARIAFAVSSSIDSRVVLDTVGAERLLGAGDMLFQKPDAPSPMRMQGCYVSDDELNKVIDFWKSHSRSVVTVKDAVPKASLPTTPTSSAEQPSLPSETPFQPVPPAATIPQPPLLEEFILTRSADSSPREGEDEFWEEAVLFIKKSGKASTSMLQRRFRIGYTRAARLIDRMEEEGIIPRATGNNKAREINQEEKPASEETV